MLYNSHQKSTIFGCKISYWVTVAVWLVFSSICGCAHTVSFSSQVANSELKEFKHVKKLVVTPAPQDDMSSSVHHFKIMEDAMVHRMVRGVVTVTVKRYSYSLGRKIDEVIIGVVGCPFTPLAMVGGMVNGESDLMLFPLTTWNPFKNFRPDKGGIFTGPLKAEYEEHTENGEWQTVPPVQALGPLVCSPVEVELAYHKLNLTTDKDGVVALDLANFLDQIQYRGGISLIIRTSNLLQCTYHIPKSRLLSLQRRWSPQPVPVPTIPQPRVSPQPVPVPVPQPRVSPQPLPVPQPRVSPQPKISIIQRIPISKELGQEQLSLYRVLEYGYWVNEDGLAVLALPVSPDVKVYLDEYLRCIAKVDLDSYNGYYVFDFALDPVTQAILAVKIGETPLEKEAYGWVSAQHIYFWNTLYRIEINSPFVVYPTYESCAWKNPNMAQQYVPSSNSPRIFPVLEQKNTAWCIAYPASQGHGWHYGWIQWQNSVGKLQGRLMKHKLDVALNYLEKDIVWGKSQEELERDLKITLRGPLSLLKITWERFFSSYNQEYHKSESISRRFVDVPQAIEDYTQFRQFVISLSDILLEKNLWQGRDILYLPIELAE